MTPQHRGTRAARERGVDDAELARRRLAGEDWCTKHNDGAGGFVSAHAMSSSVANQCSECVLARQRQRHALVGRADRRKP